MTAKEFWDTLQHCCGYPKCDGDLVAIPHSQECPLFGQIELTMFEFAEAYSAHRTAQMREVLQKLVDWNAKHPKTYIMNEYLLRECEAELDAICAEASTALSGSGEARPDKFNRLIEAARCIRHWHDWGKENEGMVVSSEHVRKLWEVLNEFPESPAGSGEAQSGDGWIKCSERLPKVGEWCLVIHAGIVQRMAAHLFGRGYACADGYAWAWADSDADPAELDDITHWRPLPSAPRKD